MITVLEKYKDYEYVVRFENGVGQVYVFSLKLDCDISFVSENALNEILREMSFWRHIKYVEFNECLVE